MTQRRIRAEVAEAASGMIAHSRYQGCTTGPRASTTARPRPSPTTGPLRWYRRRRARQLRPAAARPRNRTMASTWSVVARPSPEAARPPQYPMSVVTEVQVWARVGVSRAPIQPYPVPATAVVSTTVSPPMPNDPTPARIHRDDRPADIDI